MVDSDGWRDNPGMNSFVLKVSFRCYFKHRKPKF